jgi:acyl carrier protein
MPSYLNQATNRANEATISATVRPARQRLRDLVGGILMKHSTRSEICAFSDDDTLAEIGITSIDMVVLLLSVENEFAVEVPQHEITPGAFRSISTIDALLQRLLPQVVLP